MYAYLHVCMPRWSVQSLICHSPQSLNRSSKLTESEFVYCKFYLCLNECISPFPIFLVHAAKFPHKKHKYFPMWCDGNFEGLIIKNNKQYWAH